MSTCDPSFFLLRVLTVIVGISAKEILKVTNKTETSQTVAAVVFFVCVQKQPKCGRFSATESDLHLGSDSFSDGISASLWDLP